MTMILRVALWMAFICSCWGGAGASSGQEWTRFRGPNGTGHAEASTIPVQWTSEDYNWKVDLPGRGHASPVLWGDKIFIHSADPNEPTHSGDATRYMMCLNAEDGETLWERRFESKPYRVRNLNSYASSTPTVDADHVYVAWSSGKSTTLMALTHDGDTVWERELGPYVSAHGFCTSPILVEDSVVVQLHHRIPRDEDDLDNVESYVAAFDRQTGDTLWKTPRENGAQATHAVPCLYERPGAATELIIDSAAHGITSLNPKTGEVNWESDKVFKNRPVGSPIIVSDLIFGTCGSGGGGNIVVAMRAGPNPELAYPPIDSNAPYVPTLLAKGDLVFLWYDKGIVTCIDAPTGNVYWKQRIGGDFFSSPVLIGDRICCADVTGRVTVIAADKTYKLLGRNRLEDRVHATPAVAGGRIYFRTFHHLISLGG